MNLSEQIKIVPSRFKAIFNELEVPPASIAKYLGFSYPYTLHLLNGTTRMTEETERRLQMLVSVLMRGNEQ